MENSGNFPANLPNCCNSCQLIELTSADLIFADLIRIKIFFPVETYLLGNVSRKWHPLSYTHTDIRLAHFLSNTCWPVLISLTSSSFLCFKCISSSETQTSASDGPYQQSIPLNSWKINLDLFFGGSIFDLHNRWTGFDQHCLLDPGKSYRWVLHVKAKAFV